MVRSKRSATLAPEPGGDRYSSDAALEREIGDLAWAVYAGNATTEAQPSPRRTRA